jgi:peptide/nickel transport system ATP-binding protein
VTTLEAHNLCKEYRVRAGLTGRTLKAVDDVSLIVRPRETFALVGESGSGKSTIAKMLLRLVAPTSGSITLDGVAAGEGRRATKRYRSRVQMVFQDPFSSLNPTLPIRYQLARPLRIHGVVAGQAGLEPELRRLMDAVSLPSSMLGKYPHELSGGQRQRVAIARALAPRPEVLIADEPVSMLDVSIRLDILRLIDDLKVERDLAVLYITHDLATARHFSSRIAVLRKGRLVEVGASDEVILSPIHPYTQLLVRAAPDPAAEPFVVDAERHRDHPEVAITAGNPSSTDLGHWARHWDGDTEIAAMLRAVSRA